MSFSTDIKNEISKLKISKNINLMKYELLGFIISNAHMVEDDNVLRFSTENINIIERYKYIIKVLFNISLTDKTYSSGISKKKELYTINITDKKDIQNMFRYFNLNVIDLIDKNYKFKNIQINNDNEKITFLRGIFLGGGYISNPKGNYHLELIIDNKNDAMYVYSIIEKIDIIAGLSKRKNQYIIYIKERESIVNFIALLGANVGVIHFEENIVEKEMNNNLNRVINCEMANLNKAINTSRIQIENIKYIKEKRKYNLLNDNLKLVAEKRIENPEMSLLELSNMIGISKSGLNNRFKRINQIANDIRSGD